MPLIGLSALKPLRRPRFWLGLWWAAIVLGVVVSLVPPPPIDVPRGSDKFVHLLSYGALAASAVQLFASSSALLRAGVGLVALGVALEFAQDALTSTRMLDPQDMLANAFGVVLGIATAHTPLRDLLLQLEARLRLKERLQPRAFSRPSGRTTSEKLPAVSRSYEERSSDAPGSEARAAPIARIRALASASPSAGPSSPSRATSAARTASAT